MKENRLFAPVIITILLIVYYLFFIVICFVLPIALGVRLLFGIVPLVASGVAIYVLQERVSEIRSGEYDDLSKY